MSGQVLILGATGRFGRHAAEAFWNAGWRVTLFDRRSGDLTRAAQGMDVIVNAWNPAYTDWADEVPRLTAQVIKAAKASGATVMLPGNVYVYGATAPEAFGPHLPQSAQNPLGRIRIEMEAAYRASGVPTILLRAGDFLDTKASGNWFDMKMAPTLSRGILTYPGARDVPHAWAFLPDLARAAVALVEQRQDLPRFADIAFPGYTLTGQDLGRLCARGLGRDVRVREMAWWPLRIARPFWRMAGPLVEMSYLWSKPHHLSRQSFDAVLPGFRDTDPQSAIEQAMAPVLDVKEGSDRPKPDHAAPSPAQAQ